MKNKLFQKLYIFFLIAILAACKSNKTDTAAMDSDTQNLEKIITNPKVSIYKTAKIAIRSSAQQDTTWPAFTAQKAQLQGVYSTVLEPQSLVTSALSVGTYANAIKNISSLKTFVDATDEDVFPTIMQATGGASNANKLLEQNVEHLVLSTTAFAVKSVGKEISLYECSKINTQKLPSTEVQSLMLFFKGFVFFNNKLFYKSEQELTQNIDWLKANPNIELPICKSVFTLANSTNQQVFLYYQSLNYLFRGIDRSIMPREVDHTRSLEDYEMFIKNMQQLGMQNELTYSLEAYVYINKNENDKAIAALQKLQQSKMLHTNDQKTITQTIAALQTRKNGEALKTDYNNAFVAKIASTYFINQIISIDWQKTLADNKIVGASKALQVLQNAHNLLNIEPTQTIENAKQVGKNILQKVQEVLPENK